MFLQIFCLAAHMCFGVYIVPNCNAVYLSERVFLSFENESLLHEYIDRHTIWHNFQSIPSMIFKIICLQFCVVWFPFTAVINCYILQMLCYAKSNCKSTTRATMAVEAVVAVAAPAHCAIKFTLVLFLQRPTYRNLKVND